MPKRVLALLVTAGLPFVATGCHGDCAGCIELAVVTAPVWVPIVLIDKAERERKAREAADKLRADAEKGDSKAEYEIGNQYWGRGSSEDSAEGVKWYRWSAEQGFGDAQLILGFAYQTGHGIEQDNVQADAWYIIAGSSEKSPAQTIDLAVYRREIIEANMTPEQIAEARKRAQAWKPTMVSGQLSN